MANNKYSQAEDLLRLIERLDTGAALTRADIVARSGPNAYNDYRRFLERVRTLDVSGRGDQRTWRLARRTGAEVGLEEALALWFGRNSFGPLRGSRIHARLEAQALRAQGGVHVDHQDRFDRIARAWRRLHKPAVPEQRAAHVDALLDAVIERKQCRIRYQSTFTKVVERIIEPWELFENKDIVYLFAHEVSDRFPRPSERSSRYYDIDGLLEVNPLEAKFTRPPELPEHQPHTVGFFMQEGSVEDVAFLAKDWPAERLRRRPLHASQRIHQLREDLVRVTLRIQPTDDFVGMLLGFLPHVRPEAPASLVSRFEADRGADLPVAPSETE
jgi:predicted DNA-binding transcriptional regulator YafY